MRYRHAPASANPLGEYFLGIDGGGSKTAAVIVDTGGIRRGQGHAGSANYHAVGLEAAVANFNQAAAQAAAEAGCTLPLAAGWIGIAGHDSSADHDLLLPYFYPLASAVRLTNDAELVLAALDQAIGVALIAGTGAIAVGRDGSGSYKRTSGWGHILGDEGSGYYVGHLALQAVVRALDGRGPSTLLERSLLDHWKLHSADELLTQVYHHAGKAEIARIAPLVFEVARSARDSVATRIMRQAARELALAALTVANELDFARDELPLALGGSLLLFEAEYRAHALQLIRRRRQVSDVTLVTEPALAAALAARTLVMHPENSLA